ncbi:hypothetical protein SESBI_24530 [Sesbania bispinosa]|nr:hypothetical protein SESBI_24530 [Sesbania bispinosa]
MAACALFSANSPQDGNVNSASPLTSASNSSNNMSSEEHTLQGMPLPQPHCEKNGQKKNGI